MRTTCLALLSLAMATAWADDPHFEIKGLSLSNAQTRVQFDLFPAAQAYKFLRTDRLGTPAAEDQTGEFSGDIWSTPTVPGDHFYQLQVVPIDPNLLLTTTLLNRLAYGPTPDDLERVSQIGPKAFIQEQLAPESIQENLAVDAIQPPSTGWEYFTATGTGSSSTLYVYLNARGEGFIDDLNLVAGTAAGVGPNLIRNGGFETALSTNDWVISPNHASSVLTTEIAHSGNSSLKLVASAGGTTKDSAIWQAIAPALSTSRQYTLSFWFLASTNRPRSVTVRLSGSGIVASTSGSLMSQLTRSEAGIDTLRSWHIRHAIESKKQLLEVMLQFLENHFVTEYSKSLDYFDQFYNGCGTGRS